MSAHLLPMPGPIDRAARAQRGYQRSVDELRVAIATVSTVSEAFEIYCAVKALAEELAALADRAGERCEQLLSVL